MVDETTSPDTEVQHASMRAKISDFLAQQLDRTDDQQCVAIEMLFSKGGGAADEVLGAWIHNSETVIDRGILPKLVGAIIDGAEADAGKRPVGMHGYVVRTTQLNGIKMAIRFGVNNAPEVEQPSPYFHTTMRTIRIKNPLSIEITTSPNTKLIQIRNPLDIEMTYSVDSSHAPPVRQDAPIEVIVAAIQPFIAQFFQKIDEIRGRPTKPPEPEN